MGVLRLLVLGVAVVLVLEAVGVPALGMLEGAGYDVLEWLIKRAYSPW
jgi:hypothetical protein